MSGQRPRNRRTRLIINKPVQSKIILGMSFVPMLALVGATLSVAILTSRVLDEARAAGEQLPTLGPLFVSLFLFILAAGGVVVIQALRFSHRIAGPMYRLIKTFERVREGDWDFQVNLRDGDQLEELAEEVNRVLTWLQQHPPQGVEPKPQNAQPAQAEGADFPEPQPPELTQTTGTPTGSTPTSGD